MASTITFEKLITEAKTYLHEEKNIQLIFTSHNTYILQKLRPL